MRRDRKLIPRRMLSERSISRQLLLSLNQIKSQVRSFGRSDQQVPVVPAAQSGWPAKVSAIAQLATVALLAFGYFYTVRPIYQKDALAEEVAKLQTERVNLQSEIEAARADHGAVLLQLHASNEEMNQLKGSVARLVKDREQLEKDVAESHRSLAEAKAERRSVEEDLESSRMALQKAAQRIYADLLISSVWQIRQSGPILEVSNYDDGWDASDFQLRRVAPADVVRSVISQIASGGIGELVGVDAANAEIARLSAALGSLDSDDDCPLPTDREWEAFKPMLADAASRASDRISGQCLREYQLAERVDERLVQFGGMPRHTPEQLDEMRRAAQCPSEAAKAGEHAARLRFEEAFHDELVRCRDMAVHTLSALVAH